MLAAFHVDVRQPTSQVQLARDKITTSLAAQLLGSME